MISKEILESVECAVPHECPKKTNSSDNCVYCEIDFSFIADDPVLLQCQHHVCRQCKDKVANRKCKICDKVMNVTDRSFKTTELLIQANLRDLFKSLKIKFSKAIKLYLSNI